MSQQNTRNSFISRRHLILAALGLVAFLLSALPASAATAISTFKTGIIAVPPGQSLHATVADVASSIPGGTLKIELFDGDGNSIGRLEKHLSKGNSYTLSVDADDIPFVGPFLQVRAVITVKKDLLSDLVPMTTIVVFDHLALATRTPVSCVGPSATDPEAEFNEPCPDVWQATTIIL